MSTQVEAVITHDVFIAFIDILGFSALATGKDWKDNVANIFRIVGGSIRETATQNEAKIVPEDPMKWLFASDSIVLWIKPDSEHWTQHAKALRFLLHAVEKIQYQCAIQNIWMRGGVSYGGVTYNGSNVAGPGFINAYRLEAVANYPRVLVDAGVIKDVFERSKTFSAYINGINQTFGNPEYSGHFLYDYKNFICTGTMFKEDYPFFVHYLNRLALPSESSHLDAIWEHLRNQLYASTPSIFQKYQWVHEYLKHYAGAFDGDNPIRTKLEEQPL